MELVNKQVGSEAAVEVRVEGLKLVLVMKYDGAQMDGEMKIAIDGEQFADKLAAAIPGKIDDAVIGMLKAALKA